MPIPVLLISFAVGYTLASFLNAIPLIILTCVALVIIAALYKDREGLELMPAIVITAVTIPTLIFMWVVYAVKNDVYILTAMKDFLFSK